MLCQEMYDFFEKRGEDASVLKNKVNISEQSFFVDILMYIMNEK
jgi:hypothetical protein